MIAKIIIKRRFKEGNNKQILALLKEMRSKAMTYPGYISGETLMKPGFPYNMIIICSWQSLEDWANWKKSDTRQKYEAMLELYQTRPTEYEEYLLGTTLTKD